MMFTGNNATRDAERYSAFLGLESTRPAFDRARDGSDIKTMAAAIREHTEEVYRIHRL